MNRDEVIAALADEIVQGVNRVGMGTVMGDRRLFSHDDEDTFLSGDRERWLDMHARMEKYALSLAVAWLQSDPRGKALVDERIEGERWWQEQHDNDAALADPVESQDRASLS